MKKANQYMNLAIEEARRGIREGHGGPFGCVIVKDGEVVGRGHNVVLLRRDPTCHGEMMAIRRACEALGRFQLKDCELYTTGEPCPMCRGAILWAEIPKVYYGCGIDDTERIGFRDRRFYESMREGEGRTITSFEELEREACLELYEEYRGIAEKESY